jgi:DNA-binding SARP family transcriptional activator
LGKDGTFVGPLRHLTASAYISGVAGQARHQGIRFRVLGPVELVHGDRSITVGHSKQRSVLAVLLIEANQTVPTEQFIDRVWGENPPARVRNVLSGYITRIRAAITAADDAGDVTVSRRSGGYVLVVPPDRVDLHRFRALVTRAEDADRASRATLLGEALSLWRGPAFAGTAGSWLDGMRTAVARERLSAVIARAQASLQLGQHAQIVDELTALAAEQPLDERVAGKLMLALHGSGRQAQALSVYAAMRDRLAEELGVDPGDELRRLHRQLLGSQEAPTVGEMVPRSGVVPRQLPPAAAHFTGRTSDLRQLAEQTAAVAAGHPSTVVISVIHGSAGVGKTTLAVYWAHQAAAQFPDGQIYLNLRGFDQSQPPLQPTEALAALLRALDIAPQHVPATLDEQASLYRSVVAGKRLLIVLDNAATTGQVRPLLPGAHRCMVLVTSRNQLSGLAAGDGARQLALDVLGLPDALTLLSRIVGEQRVAAESAAAEALAELSARLPLALRIVANHLLTRPDAKLTELRDELADEQHRLDALATDEDATTVRAVFSLSYHALKPPAARTFRLLGLHEGQQISDSAAAALAGVPVAQIPPLLATLCEGHLLERVGPRRYQFHDLLRLYAAERARVEESPDDQRRITRRMLGWYLATAAAADRILAPGRFREQRDDLDPEWSAVTFTDHGAALAWCEAESRNVLACVRQAAATGEHIIAWQLARAQRGYFELRMPWPEWLSTHEIGLESARHLGDRAAQATLLNNLGSAHYYPRRFAEASRCYREAQAIWQELGDLRGQANTTNNLGNLLSETRQLPAAIEHYQQALVLYRASGDSPEAAVTMTNLAETLCLMGAFEPALDFAEQALARHRVSGNRRAEALTLSQFGNALLGLGRPVEAEEQYLLALDVSRAIGDRQAHAWACHYLAEALHAAGRPAEAHPYWQRAIVLFDALGDPQAGDIRVRLAGLEGSDG